MDVINKLYSSVSSTVSQLSGVLPGNPVTREYEILDHIASAGIGLLWKVYKGYKKTTKQEVAIFVLEKKLLERWPKEDRDMMFDILKRGIQQLTKIRHPHVLTVQHPLEESRESLAFASEPVFASLANLLSNNATNNNNINSTPQSLADFKLHDVEIKHGMLQLAEGLQFLHSDMKLIHRNLCPESIIINKQGSWKIFGFDFCIQHQLTTDGKCYWPHQEYNSSWHALTQPCLEYTAPEVALNSTNTPESDLFSLGVLIFAIYAGGKPIKLFGKDYSSFRRFASELNQGKYPNLSCIPSDFQDFVKTLLHASPQHRAKLHEVPKISFFEDIGVKTLNYLDSLYQWDNLQKSKFYKGLPQIIPTFPHRISMQHILPSLIKEFVNSSMVPFVLPNVILIAEKCTKQEYVEQILPHLKSIMKLQEPIQILLIFMQNMNLLLKLTPAEDVKNDVLPMVYRALESSMPQMQELCLGVLPTFSTLIDYQATKTSLIPRIKSLCLNSQNISVKVNCLICIGKLLDSLDKWLVLDEILPFLTKIDSRDPAVLMGIVGIYKIAMTNTKLGITKEIMATKVIPFLMPLCIENGLTINQFNNVITVVKDMVAAVEKEHKMKLEQLSTIQKEANALNQAATTLTQELGDLSFKNNSNNNNNAIERTTKNNNFNDDMFANVKIMPPPSFDQPIKPVANKEPEKNLPTRNTNNILSNTKDQVNQFPSYQQNSRFISDTQNLNLNKNNNFSNISNDFNSFQSSTSYIPPSSNTYIAPNAGAWPSQTSNVAPVLKNNYSNGDQKSLSSLDPFLDYRNKNKVPMNQMTSNDKSIHTPLLMPQNDQRTEAKNLCSLSQQDILDFLN